MKKKIGIHGAVYGRNFGDILIIQILIKYLSKKNNCEFSIPMGFKRFTDYLPTNSILLEKNILPSVIIFGPGGYLGEPKYNLHRWNIRFVLYHGFLIILSVILRIPVIVHGAGVGPINSRLVKAIIRILFKRSAKIHVRDIESFNNVKKIYPGINTNILTWGGDVALGIQSTFDIEPISHNEYKGQVGIHMPVGSNISFPKNLSDDILSFVKNNKSYNFKILYDGPSQKIHENLSELLSKKNVTEIKFTDPESLLNDINKCEIVVSTKLHVGICTYALQRKIISTYTHHKNKRFFDQICRPKNAIFIEDYESGWFERTFNETLKDDNFNERLFVLANETKNDLESLSRKLENIFAD
jgi:polysaccharide pyruvyl transferase WcaK-like protein